LVALMLKPCSLTPTAAVSVSKPAVRIGPHDREGLGRFLRYCARPPSAGQRIRSEGEQIIFRCPKAPAGEQGGTSIGGKRDHEIVITPLEFIAGIEALILRQGSIDIGITGYWPLTRRNAGKWF
jgi:Putative transposase